MQTDRDRIDELQENLNTLIGVIAQTQQQMQTLVAGMQAMRSRIGAQQREIAELKAAVGQAQHSTAASPTDTSR